MNQKQLQQLLHKHQLRKSEVSLLAISHPSNMPLLEQNSDRLLNPASNAKLLITAAALEHWGAAHRFRTQIFLGAPVRQGVLDGNLVVKGSGDPSLVSEELWRLARDLHNLGLREVRGSLVGDDSLLVPMQRSRQQAANRAYNAAHSALSLNYNHLQVWVAPSSIGQPALVTLDPNLGDWIELKNQTETVKKAKTKRLDARIDAKKGTHQLVARVSGKIGSKRRPALLYRPIEKPSLYMLSTLRTMMSEVGIAVRGGVKLGKLSDGAELFYEKESLPLGQIVLRMNKFSNNFIADQVAMLLGAELFGEPGTNEKGAAAIRRFWKNGALSGSAPIIERASGLSQKNRVSADQLVELLKWCLRKPQVYPEMIASLAIFGADGTAKDRPSFAARGAMVRAKTGSLNGVSTLAGYLYKGEKIIPFAFMIQSRGKTRKQLMHFQDDLIHNLLH